MKFTHLDIKYSNDGVLITEKNTGIFGFGLSYKDAREDLTLAFQDHYEFLLLEENCSKLASGLESQLKFLKTMFEN